MTQDPSQDRVIFDNEWLQVKQTPDDYIYSHENKSGGHGVAVLIYRGSPRKVAGRYERCPCHHDNFALCALTGQVEHGEDVVATAVREVFEEAGVTVGYHEMESLGTCRPTKSTDTTMHMFAVDIGNERDLGRATGDGTRGEEGAYCQWISADEAIHSKDPILATLVARAFAAHAKKE